MRTHEDFLKTFFGCRISACTVYNSNIPLSSCHRLGFTFSLQYKHGVACYWGPAGVSASNAPSCIMFFLKTTKQKSDRIYCVVNFAVSHCIEKPFLFIKHHMFRRPLNALDSFVTLFVWQKNKILRQEYGLFVF